MVVSLDRPASGGRFSLLDRVNAFALVLQEEFGVPFAFYHADTGEEIGLCAAASPPGEPTPVGDRCLVVPDRPGRLRLVLPLRDDEPPLVAVGVLASLARTPADAEQERFRLQRWLQSVGHRLAGSQGRLGPAAVAAKRREKLLCAEGVETSGFVALLTLDVVVRSLRVHRGQEPQQKHILQAAATLLGCQTLAWVPHQLSEDVLLHETRAALSASECRQLATVLERTSQGQKRGLVVCNAVQEASWGGRFPGIHHLLAVLVADTEPTGWMIAVNKVPAGPGEEAAFRRTDAALLAPFTSTLGLLLRASRRYRDLKELLVGLARSLTAAIDAKDAYTYGHSERVARIAVELAREMGLPADERSDVYLAGLLHDIGKIGIRDTVLGKREPLTEEEHAHVREHVTIGYKILADLLPIRHLLSGVLSHHERYDGRGYPEGLRGEDIPRLARILAVADSYDAMSTSRPYREALPAGQVEQILIEGAGSQWDRQVVDAFLRCRQRLSTIRQQGLGESLRFALDGALRASGGSTQQRSASRERQRPEEGEPVSDRRG
jgi:putative nucleotidyltransferase with HDIG domain